MGLFNKKKKEERMLPLPEFPKLTEPNFPLYDEQVDTSKDFQKPQEFRKIMPSEDFSFEKAVPSVSMEKEDMSFEDFAPRRSPMTNIERHDDKPLFVKVDKYKESMRTVDSPLDNLLFLPESDINMSAFLCVVGDVCCEYEIMDMNNWCSR